MDDFEEALAGGGRVVVSSEDDFADTKGKNPPHLKARQRFEEIVAEGHFVCTHEYGAPVSFEISSEGCVLQDAETTESQDRANTATASAADAVRAARGTAAPPRQEVGFGRP